MSYAQDLMKLMQAFTADEHRREVMAKEEALLRFMKDNMDARLCDIYLATFSATKTWEWRRTDRKYE